MSLSGIEKFRAPYEGALKKFEAYFQSQVGQFEPELKETVADVLKHPGKRLRPMFVLGVAGLAEAQKERSWKIAAIVEFIHLATLVHDDILDSAQTRHGATSHYIKFGPQVSVLTGDTLFLRANELAATEEDVRVGRLVAAAAKATCSGEIAQSLTARENIRISYEQYERFLLLKTGKLFGLSCELGSYLAGEDLETQAAFRAYGENFGIAYQLYDDAVDIWGSEAEYKKTLGTDQLQQKWTFPWLKLAEKVGYEKAQALFFDREKALQKFQENGIDKIADNLLEGRLNAAMDALKGHPRASEFEFPLSAIRQKWSELRQERKARAEA